MSRFPKLLTGLFREFRNSYNEGVDKIDAELDLQKHRVDELIQKAPQPSEVVDARGGMPVLRDRLDNVDALLAQLETKKVDTKNIEKTVQSIPPKEGIQTNSPKIINKISNNNVQIFQALQGIDGYLRYNLQSGVGGSGGTNTGVNWDLLRVTKIDVFTDGYVWFYEEPVEGALEEIVAPSKIANQVEQMFLFLPSNSSNESNNKGSLSGDLGIGARTIPANITKTWNLNQTSSRTIELMFYTSGGSSDNIDILVDGIVLKNINCKLRPTGRSNGVLTVKLDVSNSHYSSQANQIQIQIRNNHPTSHCYFVGFNVKKLKDWKNEQVNNYKFIGSNKVFLDATGASDYAIKDIDTGLWVGSYHGGETSLLCKIRTYLDTTYRYEPYQGVVREFSLADLPDNWGVTSTVVITQRTNLNNKAETLSKFLFDKDGSFEMDFGIYNNSLRTDEYYTALTSTHPSFNYLVYPKWVSVPSDTDTFFVVNEGKVTQRCTSERIEMTIRFTRFNDFYNTVGTFVRQNNNYSKFYYGVVQKFNGGVVIPNLNFSKGLDFTVNWF